jgi:Restriction endonuclease
VLAIAPDTLTAETETVASWREHQAEVAEFFRSLGLEVRTDERLKGLRSTHDIDVVVRGQHVGLHQLWLVECRHWNLPVGKVNVAALAAIVRDVGADRGLLLSDTGFQAGAIQLAERSQVTLTSLEELHEQSTGELLLLTLARFRRRLARLGERLAPLSHAGRHSADINAVRPQRGVDIDAVLRLHVALGTAENGLQQADSNAWPVLYGWDFERDDLLWADDPQHLWAGLATALDEAERLLVAHEDAMVTAQDDEP